MIIMNISLLAKSKILIMRYVYNFNQYQLNGVKII